MPDDWVQLLAETIDPAAVCAAVKDPAAGGIAVFFGTTRAEQNERGQELVALEYEAYPEMALKQMVELARRVRLRWPAFHVAILHRTGRVPLAEPSVAIAISTPHRAEAFDACRWLIDTLKSEVTIWKKEIWADGNETWKSSEF